MITETRNTRRLRLWLVALVASVALGCGSASNASALSIGMMSGGNAWQEPSQWDAMQKSGATIYRLMIRNEANWQERYDKAFRLAAERGITILPYIYTFNGSTQFPYAEATGPGGSPWETWVYTVVHRYGYNGEFWNANPGVPYKPVPAWEVWNEPNLKENNPGGAKVQPENYARFLKRTAAAIQQAQQERTPGVGVPVLFGGLITGGETSTSNFMTISEFLDKADNVAGVGPTFNGLSLHPYPHRNGAYGQFGVQGRVENARAALNATFGPKQLWITEIGWTLNDTGQPSGLWVTEQQQMEYLMQSFHWLKQQSAGLNIQSIIYFMYRDCPGCGLKWADFTGLRRADGTFRPAWYAFQEHAAAKAWPALEWQPNDNLGKPANGGLTSDPDMSTWGYGRLDIFARGPNNELVHKAYENGWHPWENLGGTLASGPSAVSWSWNRIDIVARATDGTILHWAWDGTAYVGPDNLGKPANGGLTSDPDISSRGYGILDIFARGAGGELEHREYNGGWKPWENLGQSLVGGPGAVSWSSHRMDIVGRQANNTVGHWAWNEIAWPFDNLGGNITSDPDISSRGNEKLDIFAKGGGNELVHKWWDNGWSWWESLGGTMVGGPGAVSWNGDRIDVVARTADGSLNHWSYGFVLPP
jgi:hypothetical protein